MTINFSEYENPIDAILAWKMALFLLSLDKVEHFWKELGLDFAHKEVVKGEIRLFVISQERLDDDNQDDNYACSLATLINLLMNRLKVIENSKDVDILLAWIEHQYIPYDKEEVWRFGWRALFYKLIRTNLNRLIELGMSSDKASRIFQLAKQWFSDIHKISRKIDQIENEPLSKWDAEQYLYYQGETKDISPMDQLSQHLKRCRFDELWQSLCQILTMREFEILNKWAQEVADNDESIPTYMYSIPMNIHNIPPK